MWDIYDQLIELIPENLEIKEIAQTTRWTLVDSGQGVGTAMNFPKMGEADGKKYQGHSLRTVTELVKSWNYGEASIGLAAINSYLNAPQQYEKAFAGHKIDVQDALNPLPELVKEQKIGMIGHFGFVDQYPQVKEGLTIFELAPRPGDYPAAAAEFLLPQMDRVYVTASTLVNKTLPRLLQLSRGPVILVGSSCPLTPVLFRHGIDVVAGTSYDTTIYQLQQREQSCLPLIKSGTPIYIEKETKK